MIIHVTRPRLSRLLAGLLVLLAGAACRPRADLVFTDGLVYTVDAANPRAEAVAVRGNRIVFVGSAANVTGWIGPGTEVVSLEHRMLLPGFHDTHVHPVSGGLELGECDLNAAASREEVFGLVAACAERAPEGAWVRGGGYQLPFFPDGAPDRHALDRLVPDQPAYLSSADGHSAWVNTAALRVSGLDAGTPDPPEGRIVRESDGFPAGTLRESAMGLVARHLPPYTPQEYLAGLERGLEMAARFGITTLHEASAQEPALAAYGALAATDGLTARVFVSLYVDPAAGTGQVAQLAALRERYGGHPLLYPVAAKIFADGVIEAQTAALLDEYTDRPGFRGGSNFPPDTLDAVVVALDSAGFKIHIHAIGDRAIRESLDALARRPSLGRGAGPRPILAHIQLFDPTDIPRFAELGVVASFQPLWAYADTYITDLTEPRLGPARSRWLYPIHSLVASGAIVAAGSDWSVTSMNPLRAIEVAVTRRDPDLGDGPSWIPQERVELADMLRAYTLGGAYAADLEAETGSITVGKLADLVVIDRDLTAIPSPAISDAAVVSTWLEGRRVYPR